MRNFPDFFEAYLSFTEGHEATNRVHLWSAISAVAAALERKVWLNRGYYTLYANLYVFIIGQSGLIKKSTTTAIAVNLLRELKGFNIMSERLTAAALIGRIEASHKTFELNGKNIKQAPVFAYASELAVFMEEVYGSIVELLTTFYDCIPADSTKAWTSETKGGGLTRIYGPCLNILGASTKTWLRKCIPESEMEGGFSSRVVFVVENRAPRKLVPWPTLSASSEEKRALLIQDLNLIYQLKGSFQVTKGAHELFSKFYEKHMQEVVPMSYEPRFNGYLGRKGDLILKLAMIRSVSLRDSLVLEPEDIIWAVERLEELEPDMREAFRNEAKPERMGMIYEVLRFIESKPEVTHRDIVERFISISSPDLIRHYVNELLRQNAIQKLERIDGAAKIVSYKGTTP